MGKFSLRNTGLALLVAATFFAAGCRRKEVKMFDSFEKENPTPVADVNVSSLEGITEKEYLYEKSKITIKGPSALVPNQKAEYMITISSEKHNIGEAVVIAQASSPSLSSNTGIYFLFNSTTQERFYKGKWIDAPMTLGTPRGVKMAQGLVPFVGKQAIKYSAQIPGLTSGIGLLKNSLTTNSMVDEEVNEMKENFLNDQLRYIRKAGKGYRVTFYFTPQPGYTDKDSINFILKHFVGRKSYLLRVEGVTGDFKSR